MDTDTPSTPARQFAVIELFGHTRVAGELSESPMGGGALIRLTVPATEGCPAHTRDLNPKAIYAIHYCDEAAAIAALPACQPSPVVRIIKSEVAESYRSTLALADDSPPPGLYAFPGSDDDDDDRDP